MLTIIGAICGIIIGFFLGLLAVVKRYMTLYEAQDDLLKFIEGRLRDPYLKTEVDNKMKHIDELWDDMPKNLRK